MGRAPPRDALRLDRGAYEAPRPVRLPRFDPWPPVFLALVVVASLFILALLAVVVWLSFRIGGLADANATYAIGNYPAIFLDPFTYRVLLDTVGFSLVTLAVSFLFGLPAAWLAERTDLKGKNLLFTLMTVGLLLPGFAAAMGWMFLLHPRIGLVNAWLRLSFGVREPPFNILTVGGMGWVQGLSLAPLAFIMTAAVFRAMDPTLEESARASGASFAATLRRITLPLAWPGVLAAGIFVFMIGFAAFDVPAIIGWASRLFTFSSYLVLQLNPEGQEPHYGTAAALSSTLIVLAGLLSWWYGLMQRRAHRYRVVSGKAYRPMILRLGGWNAAAWVFPWPLFRLQHRAARAGAAVVFGSAILPASVGGGVPVGLAAAFLEPALGFDRQGAYQHHASHGVDADADAGPERAFSWIVLRSKVPGRAWFDFIAFLPHAVPGIVFGVGGLLFAMFVAGRTVPIFDTVWLLLLVFVISRTSYGTRMTNSGLIQIHIELEESAPDQRRGHRQRPAAHHLAAPGADAALCLALDRAPDIPRVHARGDADRNPQSHPAGRGLEPLAIGQDRRRRGRRPLDAVLDAAGHRPLLVDRTSARRARKHMKRS